MAVHVRDGLASGPAEQSKPCNGVGWAIKPAESSSQVGCPHGAGWALELGFNSPPSEAS